MGYESVLKFNGFWVDELVFRKNHAFEPSGRLLVENNFSVSYQMDDYGKDSLVSIVCSLFSEAFESEKAPFYMKLKITGQFSFVEEINDAAATNVKPDDILAANTVAILFPYVRSTITTVTAAMGVPPIILPPINTLKLLEQSVADLQDS